MSATRRGSLTPDNPIVAEGTTGEKRNAMLLAVEVLRADSVNVAAAALVELLFTVSGEQDARKRYALAYFAGFQAMLLRDDWREFVEVMRPLVGETTPRKRKR